MGTNLEKLPEESREFRLLAGTLSSSTAGQRGAHTSFG